MVSGIFLISSLLYSQHLGQFMVYDWHSEICYVNFLPDYIDEIQTISDTT